MSSTSAQASPDPNVWGGDTIPIFKLLKNSHNMLRFFSKKNQLQLRSSPFYSHFYKLYAALELNADNDGEDVFSQVEKKVVRTEIGVLLKLQHPNIVSNRCGRIINFVVIL